MKTDSQRWGEIKVGKLIELVKIHRYEKCDEFSTPLMNEVIRRLEEIKELRGTHKALCKSLTKIIKEEMLKE